MGGRTWVGEIVVSAGKVIVSNEPTGHSVPH